MHEQNLLAPANIRQRHYNLAVKTSGPQQRRIEHVRPVGSRNNNDAGTAFEPIHLDEKCVQRLFALVVAAAESCTALASNGVDLVDENDAWRMLLRLFEHISHTGSAYTHEHFDKVRAGNAEEGDFGFACNRAS